MTTLMNVTVRNVLFIPACRDYDEETLENLRQILENDKPEIIFYTEGYVKNDQNLPEEAAAFLRSHIPDDYQVDVCQTGKERSLCRSIECFLREHPEAGRAVICGDEDILDAFPGMAVYCDGPHISGFACRKIRRIFEHGYWWEHTSLRKIQPCDDGFRNVVFLDIDGVLNDDDKGPKIDKKMVLNLARIIKGDGDRTEYPEEGNPEEGAEIVLTSSWRYGLSRWASGRVINRRKKGDPDRTVNERGAGNPDRVINERRNEYAGNHPGISGEDLNGRNSDKDFGGRNIVEKDDSESKAYRALIRELAGWGLCISDIVPMMDSGPASRPAEIRAWLDHHKGVENYLILDDESFWLWDENEKAHVVTTALRSRLFEMDRYYYGLSERYIETARRVLRGDEAGTWLKLRLDERTFVDKSLFIRDWWESGAYTYVITRPYGSGKSVNLRMLNCFFSNRYAGRGETLFGGTKIWEMEEYRDLQGKFPTVFLDFSDVRCKSFPDAETMLYGKMQRLYIRAGGQIGDDHIPAYERDTFKKYQDGTFDSCSLADLLMGLVFTLSRVYGKRVLIFLDGYDVPAVYAWMYGYWDELKDLFGSFFISGFKEHQDIIGRTVMAGTTGMTVMDLNCSYNPAWSSEFGDDFGFTEEETDRLLDVNGLLRPWNRKEDVKKWYREFSCSDDHMDLYSPASILSYIRNRDLRRYWMKEKPDELISCCLRRSGSFREALRDLLENGRTIHMEDKIFNFYGLREPDFIPAYLNVLMYNAGYLAAREVPGARYPEKTEYELFIPNREKWEAVRALLSEAENDASVSL